MVKSYVKQLVKVQGIKDAKRVAEDNLKIATEAMTRENPPFSDEIAVSMGDSKRQKVAVNQKKQDKRLNKTLNFWKQVNLLLKD